MSVRRLTGAGMALGVLVLFSVVSAVAAPTGSSKSSSGQRSAQRIVLKIYRSSAGNVEARVIPSNFAIAPDVPVRVTFVNFTREFHTFTVRGLDVNALINPARGRTPAKTTVTFTASKAGVFRWYCVLCIHGVHGMQHAMNGKVYAIVGI